MRRRISILCIAVSLLARTLAAYQWARSHLLEEHVGVGRPWGSTFFRIADGELRAEIRWRAADNWFPPYDSKVEYWAMPAEGRGAFPDVFPGSTLWYRGHDFGLAAGERWGDNHFALFFPAWFCFLFAAFPALAIALRYLRMRLRSRASTNMCTTCGYDLRASPSRCPECGVPGSRS